MLTLRLTQALKDVNVHHLHVCKVDTQPWLNFSQNETRGDALVT